MTDQLAKCHCACITLGIGLLLITTLVAEAEIVVKRKDSTPGQPREAIEVWITGTIAEADAKKLDTFSQQLEHDVLRVYLNSQGGEISAAMKIGRLIRQNEGVTAIPLPARCYSSCVLIFISGVKRINFGEIGLHRPFFASAPQERQVLEKQVPLMLSLVKSYVGEMGITDNLYQQMVNTEPSQMVKYGWSDYKTLIPESDPVYEEIEISYEARQYGITTAEMRHRIQDTERCYNPNDMSRWLACNEAIRWGLSERVYEQRSQRTMQCALRDDESKVVDGIPKRIRRDHPIWIRMESCVRRIMLSP